MPAELHTKQFLSEAGGKTVDTIQTKFSADTYLFHPHFHGNRHCIGQDKARTTNPVHIAKDRANANE